MCGDTVVTQSNSCLLYLGKKLGVDLDEHFIHNHQVLDQVMDLRNATMELVYPFKGVTKVHTYLPTYLTSME